jgi:hypothetical protein
VQGYDEYVMSYSESRDVLDRQRLAGVAPPGQTLLLHAVLLDGQVVGHWLRRPSSREVLIDVQLARRFTSDEEAALDAAVERYGAFVGLPAQWSAA